MKLIDRKWIAAKIITALSVYTAQNGSPTVEPFLIGADIWEDTSEEDRAKITATAKQYNVPLYVGTSLSA